MDDYNPKYEEDGGIKYLEACHELSKNGKEMKVFLNNLFTRLVNKTFLSDDDSSIEEARAIAELIKTMPKHIRIGNDLYLENRKNKKL